MQLPQPVTLTIQTVVKAAGGVTRFAKQERVLAAVCFLIPAFLIWFEAGPIRESISAYYSMEENQVFYFLLTLASMLFIVNGVIKKKHVYNVFLGPRLAGPQWAAFVASGRQFFALVPQPIPSEPLRFLV